LTCLSAPFSPAIELFVAFLAAIEAFDMLIPLSLASIVSGVEGNIFFFLSTFGKNLSVIFLGYSLHKVIGG
jgi:hypothetical protein